MRRKRKAGSKPSAKAGERLHALRMRFKPGYREQYWKALGFNANEMHAMTKKRGWA